MIRATPCSLDCDAMLRYRASRAIVIAKSITAGMQTLAL